MLAYNPYAFTNGGQTTPTPSTAHTNNFFSLLGSKNKNTFAKRKSEFVSDKNGTRNYSVSLATKVKHYLPGATNNVKSSNNQNIESQSEDLQKNVVTNCASSQSTDPLCAIEDCRTLSTAVTSECVNGITSNCVLSHTHDPLSVNNFASDGVSLSATTTAQTPDCNTNTSNFFSSDDVILSTNTSQTHDHITVKGFYSGGVSETTQTLDSDTVNDITSDVATVSTATARTRDSVAFNDITSNSVSSLSTVTRQTSDAVDDIGVTFSTVTAQTPDRITVNDITSSSKNGGHFDRKNRTSGRIWKRRRRSSLGDDILITDISKPTTEKAIANEVGKSGARDRLLMSFRDDRMSSKVKTNQKIDEIQVDDIIQPSRDDKSRPNGSFFNRGNNLFSSVRSSLRKMGYLPPKKVPSPTTSTPIGRLIEIEPNTMSLKLEDANSNDSQDSGLGEDSDLGDASVVTSPRTPPPSSLPGSSVTPVPILRLTTCSTSVTASKKHVVILEPNRTDLPSVRRQLFRQSAPPRLETVRIRVSQSFEEEDPTCSEIQPLAGDVSSQWDQLCQLGRREAEKVVESLQLYPCDNNPLCQPTVTIGLIFATQNLNLMQKSLEELDSDAICRLIYTVYRVLFYDWLSHCATCDNMIVSVVVHCVQRFLVVVVQVCHELEAGTRLRFSKAFQQLLSSSEDNRYRDLRDCLYCTRTLYIDFWCSLLEVKRNLNQFDETWL